MRTILVTGSDTGVGKTRAMAALARLLAADGSRVQIVKAVETGVAPGASGDAAEARRRAGVEAESHTLASWRAPLAPAAAAAAEGGEMSFAALAGKLRALPPCDWRLCEGAGGIASPLDGAGRDWVDFAAAIGADVLVVVVPDRLGAINQGRLAAARASSAGLPFGIWLNAAVPPDAEVAASNRAGLRAAGLPLWAEQESDADLPREPEATRAEILGAAADAAVSAASAEDWIGRCRAALAERDRGRLRRSLRVTLPAEGELNLADNDYLDLARDPAVTAAAADAAARYGTSASASPLVTGWREPHARLIEALGRWHGFPCGLLWSSGYAANAAVLGTLPERGDLVLADRLIHHSLIAGIGRSGARLRRYPHLDLDRLERELAAAPAGRTFVVTESLFSMDGDYPDFARLAELKRRHGFCLIVDEAHALGWYGPEGSGLARAAGAQGMIDVLVGTLGKALAAGGAYTLFRDEAVRDHLINAAGEFVYSTALPPPTVAAAGAALERMRALAAGQPAWHGASRDFRAALRAAGWDAPEGESPIVPVALGDEGLALDLAASLRAAGVLAAAVRPPTVPAGTSRLRFSLKRTFGPEQRARVLAALARGREGR